MYIDIDQYEEIVVNKILQKSLFFIIALLSYQTISPIQSLRSLYNSILGRKINPQLNKIDKDCNELTQYFTSVASILIQDGSVKLFNNQIRRPSLSKKINNQFRIVLQNLDLDVLENAPEKQKIAFKDALQKGTVGILSIHDIIMEIVTIVSNDTGTIIQNKQVLKNVRQFFNNTIMPIEEIVVELANLAEKENANKSKWQLFLPLIKNPTKIKNDFETVYTTGKKLGITHWTRWQIAKWAAAGAAIAGTAYYLYNNSDTVKDFIHKQSKNIAQFFGLDELIENKRLLNALTVSTNPKMENLSPKEIEIVENAASRIVDNREKMKDLESKGRRLEESKQHLILSVNKEKYSQLIEENKKMIQKTQDDIDSDWAILEGLKNSIITEPQMGEQSITALKSKESQQNKNPYRKKSP